MRALLEPWIPEVYLEPYQTSMMMIRYLQRSKSRNRSKKQFTLLDYTVNLSPDEIFESFVELNSNLCMKMMFIQNISIRLPKIDTSNLKISKFFLNIFFVVVAFSVFLFFAVEIEIFKNILRFFKIVV